MQYLVFKYLLYINFYFIYKSRHGHMVTGYTTTCAINAYHSCEFEPQPWRGVLDTILCDKACQWLAAGRWFSPGTPVSSTNKSDQHDLTEILMKVALNTKPLHPPFIYMDTSKLYYPIGKETLAPYSVIWYNPYSDSFTLPYKIDQIYLCYKTI